MAHVLRMRSSFTVCSVWEKFRNFPPRVLRATRREENYGLHLRTYSTPLRTFLLVFVEQLKRDTYLLQTKQQQTSRLHMPPFILVPPRGNGALPACLLFVQASLSLPTSPPLSLSLLSLCVTGVAPPVWLSPRVATCGSYPSLPSLDLVCFASGGRRRVRDGPGGHVAALGVLGHEGR